MHTEQERDSDPEYRVHSSFQRQGLLKTLGAALKAVESGMVEIVLPTSSSIHQQHGFVHAGAIAAIADTAAGYAALTTMPPGAGVLTTEYKINLLAPAQGDRLIARGEVMKAGRTLTLATAKVFAEHGKDRKLVAFLTATLMKIEGRTGVSG